MGEVDVYRAVTDVRRAVRRVVVDMNDSTCLRSEYFCQELQLCSASLEGPVVIGGPDEVAAVDQNDRLRRRIRVGVGPERPASLSAGGFLRPALRTGRATSTASGSPRVMPVLAVLSPSPTGSGCACRGSDTA